MKTTHQGKICAALNGLKLAHDAIVNINDLKIVRRHDLLSVTGFRANGEHVNRSFRHLGACKVFVIDCAMIGHKMERY